MLSIKIFSWHSRGCMSCIKLTMIKCQGLCYSFVSNISTANFLSTFTTRIKQNSPLIGKSSWSLCAIRIWNTWNITITLNVICTSISSMLCKKAPILCNIFLEQSKAMLTPKNMRLNKHSNSIWSMAYLRFNP